jgi:Pentapeptide repeats (8 copies)
MNDMKKRPPLWSIIVLVAIALAALAGVLALRLPRSLYPPLSAADLNTLADPRARIELQQAQSRLANDARSTILQGFAGLLVIVGAATAWWQAYLSREGQITERFTRAVDQLGSPNVDVRVGGIYALERIANNSGADRNTIQFILGAFVRNHATWPVGSPAGPEHPTAVVDKDLPWMRVRAPDIQSAMGVLGRRKRARDQPVIYLSRTDLRSLALRGARLTDAQFRYANLARAVLTGVHLDGSNLTAADLRQAHLEGARLTRVNLNRAYLQRANLRGADLRDADLRGADLSDTILDGTMLAGARADATTTWPAEIDSERRAELGVIELTGDGSGSNSDP